MIKINFRDKVIDVVCAFIIVFGLFSELFMSLMANIRAESNSLLIAVVGFMIWLIYIKWRMEG